MAKRKKGRAWEPTLSQQKYDLMERKEQEYRQLKEERKIIQVSTQDKNDLGMLSSGWDSFVSNLKPNFKKARDAGYTRANDIASFWNRSGFKTASGSAWNARLVNIAKDQIGIKHGSDIRYQ